MQPLEPEIVSLAWKPDRKTTVAITGSITNDRFIVIGHGVSFDMNEDLVLAVSDAAVSAGWTSIRFNFPYREEKRDFDRENDVPEAEAAMLAVVKEYVPPQKRLILAGKSFGSRIAIQIRQLVHCSAFVLLSFPIRPPNKHKMGHGMMAEALDRLMQDRMKHVLRLGRPTLFIEGTNDPFMPEDVLKQIERDSLPPAHVVRIEGGDHSLILGSNETKTERVATLNKVRQHVVDFLVHIQ